MVAPPVYFPAALPSELLGYIVTRCSHPTTLVVCLAKADFLEAVADEVSATRRKQKQPRKDANESLQPHRGLLAESEPKKRPRLKVRMPTSMKRILAPAPLFQVAIARHIRIVFIPTVSHLRAFLGAFDPADSKIPPPPVQPSAFAGLKDFKPARRRRPPMLIIYGFVELHRDTSEWSAQGLGLTTATLVSAAARHGFRAMIVEARTKRTRGTNPLEDGMPILQNSARRLAAGGSWSGRTVKVRRVLGRWFRFADKRSLSKRKMKGEARAVPGRSDRTT
jgi:hypothetical protein